MEVRQKFLINKPFQSSIILYFFILLIICNSVFYGAIVIFFHNFEALALEVGLNSDHVFFSFLNSQKSQMNIIFGFAFFFTSIILFFGGLYLSHKIAGPMYRLNMYFENSKSLSEMEHVKFRESDYFKEIEQSINNLIQRS